METKKLLRKLLILGLLTIFTLIWTTSVYAAYGSATHDTPTWQELARVSHPGGLSNDWDNGVFWSISDDNGANWSDWGHQKELTVGQTIKFEFNMYKSQQGSHYADHLKSWIDWGGRENTYDDSNELYYKEYPVGTGTHFHDETAGYKITNNDIGNSYLRARVSCGESLLKTEYLIDTYNFGDKTPDLTQSNKYSNWAYYYENGKKKWVSWNNFMTKWDNTYRGARSSYEDMFEATGNYYQGEVEEWILTVAAGTGTSHTPEPATMLLFGFGLIGIARVGRNRKI